MHRAHFFHLIRSRLPKNDSGQMGKELDTVHQTDIDVSNLRIKFLFFYTNSCILHEKLMYSNARVLVQHEMNYSIQLGT